jgi:hypothetical protein
MKYITITGEEADIPPAGDGHKVIKDDGSIELNYNVKFNYVEIDSKHSPGIVARAEDIISNPAVFKKYYKGTAAEWELFQYSIGKVFYHSLPAASRSRVDKMEKSLSPKKQTFLSSKALTTQQTRHYWTQQEIFSKLEDETKDEIGPQTPSVKVFGPAIKTSEYQLIECLQKLLHTKSETKDPKSEKYYAGNYFPNKEDEQGIVKYEIPVKGQISDTRIAPTISFTRYELAKEYTGGRTPSGNDIKEVWNLLQTLANRKYLFVYTIPVPKTQQGKIRRKEIEHYRELLDILNEKEIETDENTKEDKVIGRTIHITLHPVFRDGIDKEFIIKPVDIAHRTKIATAGREIDHSTYQLREYLLQEHSAKRYTPQIGLHKLYSTIAEKYRQRRNYKKCKEKLLQGIEVCKNLGLLESWKESTSKTTGDPIITFSLCREWI